ncbi:MAG: hypothetical protein ACK5O2_02665, partial [Microthrixaceae bacterium]
MTLITGTPPESAEDPGTDLVQRRTKRRAAHRGFSERSRSQLTLDALEDVGLGELLALERFGHVDRETLTAAIEEFTRFTTEVVAPTDRDGDRSGCSFDSDTASVTTSPGAADAYRSYV